VTDAPFTGPLFTDQRGPGFARIADDGSGRGDRVDIGAFEVQDLVVNTTADATRLRARPAFAWRSPGLTPGAVPASASIPPCSLLARRRRSSSAAP
jgi:hypothetical protein